jgi:hypothetical protein
MASKATTDEEDNAVDYQAVAVARIREAVAEIDTEYMMDVGVIKTFNQSRNNIVVAVEPETSGGDIFDLDGAKMAIINAVMQSDASVNICSYNADRHFVRFEPIQ